MGILRTAGRTAVIAGTATAVSGRVARRQASKSDQQQAAQQQAAQQQAAQQQAPPAPTPAPAPAEDDPIAQVQKLAELHQQGILSDEEFAAAKAKALGI